MLTQAEIDRSIERNSQWTRHREAMQILGAALRAPGEGRRLGDILTEQQVEIIVIGCIAPESLQSLLRG